MRVEGEQSRSNRWRCSATALGALLCGCAGIMPAPTPLRSIEYPSASPPAKCLFVLLPGAGDRAETFEQRGFVEELRSRSLSIDIRATDATLGYYLKGTILDRLAADVIAPAKVRGYQEIWLMGPSMGGFGSLFYARAHTADVTGVLAIAPFLGDKDLIAEIAAAGGLPKWRAPARVDAMNPDNYQREMWRWFQAVTQGREAAPLIFAGYGTADKLSGADSLLTAELPPARVFLTTGAHEWPAWRRVLKEFLDSPEFATHCRDRKH
jgi:pimeloyl-ACP methyl ester carboxylesterase